MITIIEQTKYTHSLLLGVIANWHGKFILGLMFSIMNFFFDSLNHDALIALLVLIVFDFFSAILVSYKLKKPIQSAKIFRTALKTAVYFLVISAGFVAQKAVPLDMIDDIILGFLVLTELISILENCAKSGYAVPIGLLKFLKNFKNRK